MLAWENSGFSVDAFRPDHTHRPRCAQLLLERRTPAAATSGCEETAGRSRLTSNRRFASGRRPGWLRPRKVRSSRTWVNHSNRRRSRRPAARPPTGPSSRKSTMTATSFRRRQTSCRRSTSTASDRCRQPGHDKAPRPPDSERLRADTRKTPLQRGKAGGQGKAWCGPGDWSKRLTSRSSAR